MNDSLKRMTDAVPQRMRPSTSTVASTLAGAVVTIAVYIVEQFIPAPLPAAVVAAMTTIAAVGFGVFFSGGKSRDTK